MDSRVRRRRGGSPRRRLPAWCTLLAVAVVSALIWPVCIGWWLAHVLPPSGWPVLLVVALATLVAAATFGGRAAGPTPALAAAGLPLAAVGGYSVWTSDPLGPIGAVVFATLVLAVTVIPITFARPDPPPRVTAPPSRPVGVRSQRAMALTGAAGRPHGRWRGGRPR